MQVLGQIAFTSMTFYTKWTRANISALPGQRVWAAWPSTAQIFGSKSMKALVRGRFLRTTLPLIRPHFTRCSHPRIARPWILVLRPLDYVTKLVSGLLACELPLDGNPVAIHTTIPGPSLLAQSGRESVG